MRAAGDTVDVGDRHVGSFSSQGERDAAPDSTRSTRHQRDLP
jgi:hypothetical protein